MGRVYCPNASYSGVVTIRGPKDMERVRLLEPRRREKGREWCLERYCDLRLRDLPS